MTTRFIQEDPDLIPFGPAETWEHPANAPEIIKWGNYARWDSRNVLVLEDVRAGRSRRIYGFHGRDDLSVLIESTPGPHNIYARSGDHAISNISTTDEGSTISIEFSEPLRVLTMEFTAYNPNIYEWTIDRGSIFFVGWVRQNGASHSGHNTNTFSIDSTNQSARRYAQVQVRFEQPFQKLTMRNPAPISTNRTTQHTTVMRLAGVQNTYTVQRYTNGSLIGVNNLDPDDIVTSTEGMIKVETDPNGQGTISAELRQLDLPAHGLTLPSYGVIPMGIGGAGAQDGVRDTLYYIVEIVDADTVSVVTAGEINKPNHGLEIGLLYYLAADAEGVLQPIPATPESAAGMLAADADTLLLFEGKQNVSSLEFLINTNIEPQTARAVVVVENVDYDPVSGMESPATADETRQSVLVSPDAESIWVQDSQFTYTLTPVSVATNVAQIVMLDSAADHNIVLHETLCMVAGYFDEVDSTVKVASDASEDTAAQFIVVQVVSPRRVGVLYHGQYTTEHKHGLSLSVRQFLGPDGEPVETSDGAIQQPLLFATGEKRIEVHIERALRTQLTETQAASIAATVANEEINDIYDQPHEWSGDNNFTSGLSISGEAVATRNWAVQSLLLNIRFWGTYNSASDSPRLDRPPNNTATMLFDPVGADTRPASVTAFTDDEYPIPPGTFFYWDGRVWTKWGAGFSALADYLLTGRVRVQRTPREGDVGTLDVPNRGAMDAAIEAASNNLATMLRDEMVSANGYKGKFNLAERPVLGRNLPISRIGEFYLVTQGAAERPADYFELQRWHFPLNPGDIIYLTGVTSANWDVSHAFDPNEPVTFTDRVKFQLSPRTGTDGARDAVAREDVEQIAADTLEGNQQRQGSWNAETQEPVLPDPTTVVANAFYDIDVGAKVNPNPGMLDHLYPNYAGDKIQTNAARTTWSRVSSGRSRVASMDDVDYETKLPAIGDHPTIVGTNPPTLGLVPPYFAPSRIEGAAYEPPVQLTRPFLAWRVIRGPNNTPATGSYDGKDDGHWVAVHKTIDDIIWYELKDGEMFIYAGVPQVYSAATRSVMPAALSIIDDCEGFIDTGGIDDSLEDHWWIDPETNEIVIANGTDTPLRRNPVWTEAGYIDANRSDPINSAIHDRYLVYFAFGRWHTVGRPYTEDVHFRGFWDPNPDAVTGPNKDEVSIRTGDPIKARDYVYVNTEGFEPELGQLDVGDRIVADQDEANRGSDWHIERSAHPRASRISVQAFSSTELNTDFSTSLVGTAVEAGIVGETLVVQRVTPISQVARWQIGVNASLQFRASFRWKKSLYGFTFAFRTGLNGILVVMVTGGDNMRALPWVLSSAWGSVGHTDSSTPIATRRTERWRNTLPLGTWLDCELIVAANIGTMRIGDHTMTFVISEAATAHWDTAIAALTSDIIPMNEAQEFSSFRYDVLTDTPALRTPMRDWYAEDESIGILLTPPEGQELKTVDGADLWRRDSNYAQVLAHAGRSVVATFGPPDAPLAIKVLRNEILTLDTDEISNLWQTIYDFGDNLSIGDNFFAIFRLSYRILGRPLNHIEYSLSIRPGVNYIVRPTHSTLGTRTKINDAEYNFSATSYGPGNRVRVRPVSGRLLLQWRWTNSTGIRAPSAGSTTELRVCVEG